jgi:hypothetical protein
MQSFREILHPKGRQRVEFFCEEGPAWRFERYRMVKKQWRKISDRPLWFETYAKALAAAQNAMPWIAEALLDQGGWHLELLRGLPFRLVRYETATYGDHHHCEICWKTLMAEEAEVPGTEHEGFVTRYETPDGSKVWQWNWACVACFKNVQISMQWEEAEGSAEATVAAR